MSVHVRRIGISHSARDVLGKENKMSVPIPAGGPSPPPDDGRRAMLLLVCKVVCALAAVTTATVAVINLALGS
jgi:hypothetical protein